MKTLLAVLFVTLIILFPISFVYAESGCLIGTDKVYFENKFIDDRVYREYHTREIVTKAQERLIESIPGVTFCLREENYKTHIRIGKLFDWEKDTIHAAVEFILIEYNNKYESSQNNENLILTQPTFVFDNYFYNRKYDTAKN